MCGPAFFPDPSFPSLPVWSSVVLREVVEGTRCSVAMLEGRERKAQIEAAEAGF